MHVHVCCVLFSIVCICASHVHVHATGYLTSFSLTSRKGPAVEYLAYMYAMRKLFECMHVLFLCNSACTTQHVTSLADYDVIR